MKRKADGTPDGRTTDNRAEHLRAGGFIPERLDPNAVTTPVAAKLPPALVEHLDRARGRMARSAYLRLLVQRDADEAKARA